MVVPVRPEQAGLSRPAGRPAFGGEPASDEPEADEPASNEPASDEPASDEPASDEPASDEPGPTALQQLSRAAVHYGATLGLADRRRLAMRLYLFHRLPLNHRWMRRFADPAAVIRGWQLSGRPERALGDGWYWMDNADHRFWWSWSTRPGAPASLAGKLYVSPSPDQLADVLASTVRAVAATRSWVSLKIAADPAGLLRPDRLVCHFADPDELVGTARRLSTELAGVPAQGVPFTVVPPGVRDARAASGIVSIAADPPADRGPVSWRWWVSLRLADALLGSAQGDQGEAPESAALRVLREDEELLETRFASIRSLDPIQEICHA